MKALLTAFLVLVGCLSLDPAFAQPPKVSPESASVADTIKRLILDWADGMITADIDKVSQIMADDWIDSSHGVSKTKAMFLSAIKSGKVKLKACEFGPMDVKVLGNVAVIQGSVTETSIADGQSRSVRVSYMDVFVKQGDRWVVIRSHTRKL